MKCSKFYPINTIKTITYKIFTHTYKEMPSYTNFFWLIFFWANFAGTIHRRLGIPPNSGDCKVISAQNERTIQV